MFEIDRGAQPIISPTAARTRRRWAIPRLEPPFHTTDVIKRGHVVGDLGDCHPNIGGPIGKTPCTTSSDARRNVDDTFETLNEQVLEDVARCLSHADTTLVVAVGASHGAGSYLASSLQIIGVRAVLVT